MQIYIHLPFCKAKCQYCDFNSYAQTDDATKFSYLAALRSELKMAGKQFAHAQIKTIYIGGGTPSVLDAAAIAQICQTLRSAFDLTDLKEFTIEANPESLTEEKLAAYRQEGINRISIGAQSLDDRNLKSLGRLHSAIQAIEKLKLAGQYFDNVSCDLMIGLPYDSDGAVKEEILRLAPLVKHMSVYQLTLEKDTPLAKRAEDGRVLLPSDDEVADLQNTALDTLKSCGFYRYEVSNYARKSYESMHNMGYWTDEEYLGIGAGAHSYIKTLDGKKPLENAIRFASPKNINAYIAGINCVDAFDKVPRVEMTVLREEDVRFERIMLGLRTTKGVEKELLEGKIPPYMQKFFVLKDGRYSLTDEGFMVMNSLLVQILP